MLLVFAELTVEATAFAMKELLTVGLSTLICGAVTGGIGAMIDDKLAVILGAVGGIIGLIIGLALALT